MISPINTKEIALISVFSAVWIVAQVQFGKYLGEITGFHGTVNRLVGWLLMVIMAVLTGRFGRVTAMTGISALATRIARTPRDPSEATIAGFGYFAGGLLFDLIFFTGRPRKLEGKNQRVYALYILFTGLASASVASLPWQLYKLYFLGPYGYLAYFLSLGGVSIAKEIIFSVVGTSMGLSAAPRIRIWRIR